MTTNGLVANDDISEPVLRSLVEEAGRSLPPHILFALSWRFVLLRTA